MRADVYESVSALMRLADTAGLVLQAQGPYVITQCFIAVMSTAIELEALHDLEVLTQKGREAAVLLVLEKAEALRSSFANSTAGRAAVRQYKTLRTLLRKLKNLETSNGRSSSISIRNSGSAYELSPQQREAEVIYLLQLQAEALRLLIESPNKLKTPRKLTAKRLNDVEKNKIVYGMRRVSPERGQQINVRKSTRRWLREYQEKKRTHRVNRVFDKVEAEGGPPLAVAKEIEKRRNAVLQGLPF